MDVAGQLVSLPGLFLLGVVVGVVAGMFGVGGGFLLTPLLAILFGVPLPIAVGTGLCQMVGTAVVALLRHRTLGQGELRIDFIMLAGSLAGVGAGTATVATLADAGEIELAGGRIALVTVVLYGAYVVLLVASSWLFWRQAERRLDADGAGPLARWRLGPKVDLPAVPLQGVSGLTIAYVGVGLGYLSGLLGIGGGVALMPVLIYGFGFPIKQAAGTGILALLITVSLGTVQHALEGHVHLGLAMVLLVGSSLSAQLGAVLTRRLPARTLRRIFAVLLWLTVAAIVWDVWRQLRASGA